MKGIKHDRRLTIDDFDYDRIRSLICGVCKLKGIEPRPAKCGDCWNKIMLARDGVMSGVVFKDGLRIEVKQEGLCI